uniref:Uncharacterized protein n=1 Tax=Salix viminalis TaxID=40686 RepID=A0A6N2KLL5_SALVM
MSATATTAQNLSKTSPLLAPAVVAAYAAYRYKSELADGCQKISGANKLLSSSSSVACESNLPEWPALSISRSSRFRFHQHLHCWSSKEHNVASFACALINVWSHGRYIRHNTLATCTAKIHKAPKSNA